MLPVAVLVEIVAAAVPSLAGAALLWLSDNARLPPHASTATDGLVRGYDIEELDAPRLAGPALRIFAVLIRMPGIGRLVSRVLAIQNDMVAVRRTAALVPDPPLYYPTVVPPPSGSRAKPLDLVAFRDATTTPDEPRDPEQGFRHWTIHDYTSRYQTKQLSPVQVARAVLAAIATSDQGPRPLRLFIEFHEELVLAQAHAAAARYARGEPLGVLDGVPVAVKDELAVVGHRMTMGTSFLGEVFGVAREDALSIARLRAQGAILVGTTNMHELGIAVTGFNMVHGTVRNPHNPAHYTGGSSSGSAAAVAAGVVPLAIGLDGGGSIRIPAGLCGVVGFKPTFQRVPEITPDCPSVCATGPLAGSVRDAAIAYAVLSGGDASLPHTLAHPLVDLHSFEDTHALHGLRVAYYEPFNQHSTPAIASAVMDTLQQLATRGATLVRVELDALKAINLAHNITCTGEIAQNMDRFYSEFHRASPEVQVLINYARQYTGTDLLAAQRVRAFALRQLQERVFRVADVLVTPMTAITAPVIPPDAVAYGELDALQLGRLFRFALYANLAGTPAISVPIAYDASGLPISLQVQANHFDEDTLLRVAHAVEQLHAPTQRKPQVYFSILENAASICDV